MNTRSLASFLVSASIAGVLVASVLTAGIEPAGARVLNTSVVAAVGMRSPDNHELINMFDGDQRDHVDKALGRMPAATVAAHETARLARLHELVAAGRLRTSADYHHAAILATRSSKLADAYLAHDWALAALGMGDRFAAPIAAASEDRYLLALGQPQRFGTQAASTGSSNTPAPTNDVTDQMREAVQLPPLHRSVSKAFVARKVGLAELARAD